MTQILIIIRTKARMMRVEDKLGRAMSLENLRLEIMTMNIQCIVEVNVMKLTQPEGFETMKFSNSQSL